MVIPELVLAARRAGDLSANLSNACDMVKDADEEVGGRSSGCVLFRGGELVWGTG